MRAVLGAKRLLLMKKVAEKLDGLVLSCAMSSQEVSGSLAMLRAVLGAKRLLLAKKVAEEIGWPDTELFSELATGFGLVGRDT